MIRMAVLVTKWFGTFLCDENRILKKILFPKDAAVIADGVDPPRQGDGGTDVRLAQLVTGVCS